MNNLVFGVTRTCQMTHLTKMSMKETSRREGVGMLLTKFHIYSLFTTSHCAKQTQNHHEWKKCSFSFQNSIGLVYFLAIVLVAIIFELIITLHDQKSFGKMGEKAVTILGTQGVNNFYTTPAT